jgi:hypothetical protein
MKPEEVHIGATVRVRERHRIAERRGMVGKVTDHYGGDGYMAVDVRFSGDTGGCSGLRTWRRSHLPDRFPRPGRGLSPC